MPTTKHRIATFAILMALTSACPASEVTPDANVDEDANSMDAPSTADAPVANDTNTRADAAVANDTNTGADAPTCAAGETRCGTACVNLDTDATHCGACDMACATGQSCVAGTCECPMGQELCSGACIDPNTSTANCGMCGNACPMGQMCVSGACRIDCPAPRVICGTGTSMECLDTATDTNHCGTCTNVCPTPANAASACTMGACGLGTCNAGYGNCDGNADNGCETDTTTSATSCGGCGRACDALPHATTRCVMGACGLGACDPGYADCDGILANGCEVNVDTDATHCGGCGIACAVPNAASTCSGGVCGLGACDPGYADCDLVSSNGCEVNTASSPSNCGGCGLQCDRILNGTGMCRASMCTVSCNAGFANCDGIPFNGCEADINIDVSNCGLCGRVCRAVPNGAPRCQSRACGVACNAGFADCNLTSGDGCEVNTTTSVSNCGGCGRACVVANGAPTCRSGACGIASCNAGFADCNLVSGDGCEVNVNTDSRNCGSCGRVCPGLQTCSLGTCG